MMLTAHIAYRGTAFEREIRDRQAREFWKEYHAAFDNCRIKDCFEPVSELGYKFCRHYHTGECWAAPRVVIPDPNGEIHFKRRMGR